MFGLGPLELIIVLIIVLLIFGLGRLTGIGSSASKMVKDFKKSYQGLDEKDVTPRGEAESNEERAE